MYISVPRNPARTDTRQVTDPGLFRHKLPAQLLDARPVHSEVEDSVPCSRRGADVDYIFLTAEPALQVIDIPAPAAALRMDIIICLGDDDGAHGTLQQVLQALEGGDRVPRHSEWVDTLIKCRVIPAADAGIRPWTRREWLAHNLCRQAVYIVR